MWLHILSDLHLEHSFFEMPVVKIDVLILAGDMLTGQQALVWSAREQVNAGRAVIQVAGNHEFYGQTMQVERALPERC